jgi:hypothetical protein
MAGNFITTGTYSNLTRLELESLRLADDSTIGKALTVGDSALPPEGVVGPGLDPNAEPFLTSPTVKLDDVYALTPPAQPGPGLGTLDQPGVFVSETVKWFGPFYITDGTQGYASATNIWTDTSGVNFTLVGIQQGDILVVKPGLNGENNPNYIGTVQDVSPTTLTLSNIFGPGAQTTFGVDAPTATTSYIVLRPNAVQLFAVPASGATGFEQTFLTVVPGSSIHNTLAPTTDQINAVRITDLVPAQFGLDATVDRADAIYDAPAPRLSLDRLGYRIVLYPDDGSGTAPNLATPIATIAPVINSDISPTDQRMTVDYKAGVIRFSCAPSATGSQIKVAGGVNPTTGRLNLYAIFWAVDTSLTAGASRSVYGLRSSTTGALSPGRIAYDTTNNAWRIGATTSTNSMLVQAPNPTEDTRVGLSFGAYDATSGVTQNFRYFTYRQGSNRWKFVNSDLAIPAHDTASTVEMYVGESLSYTVGGIDSPPAYGADYMASATRNTSTGGRGARDTDTPLQTALNQAAVGSFGTVRLKRGRYQITDGIIYVPPGVTIEGEGPNTVIQLRHILGPTNTTVTPGLKFGPNTPYGVFDISYRGGNVHPTTFDYTSTSVAQRLEGVGVVWNSVRRVWAVAWADTHLNAIWFNEIHRDGTTTFPGFGQNIKNDSLPLFSTLSPNSSNHTGGHYPRIAHQANSDQYSVAWVSQITLTSGPSSGVAGPSAYFKIIQVNPSVPDPNSTSASGTPASLTAVTPNPVGYLGAAPTSFTDHPSIAVDNSSVNSNYTMWLGAWGYQTVSGTIQSSYPFLFIFQGGVAVSHSQGGTYTTAVPAVISSTDVDEDGSGNALWVWSRRAHPLITGSAGTMGNGSTFGHLTDPSISNWEGLGIALGSRFMYLGAQLAFDWSYDPTFGLPNNATNITPYGLDGTVWDANVGYAQIRPDSQVVSGGYSPGVPYLIVNSTTTAAPTTTLTDSSQNFTTNGVGVGDMVLFPNDGQFPTITAVAPGGNIHELTLSAAPTGLTGNQPYRVYFGRPFNWAITPPSVIEGQLYSAVISGNAGGILEIAGYNYTASFSLSYVLEPNEPDFVRIRRGGDSWLVVYQSFKTTSFMSHDSQKNWNDGLQPWNSGTFLDNTLYMRETSACYRWHLSTCAIVLSSTGTPLSTTYNQGMVLGTPATTYTSKLSRDTEISNRSLGALADPITYRPNYIPGNGNPRFAQNLALQVSPHCWFQRWTSSATPGLLPDVTWTGDDWVVVSPTKKTIHSYTGNYFVDGSGNAYLGDPGMYFGLGGPNSVDANWLRATVQVGDFIYFPAINAYANITGSHSEHTVELGVLDSHLFGYGNNTQHTNIEWMLVRTATGGPQVLPAGVRSLGYRVAYDGKVIVSSTFMTFADELPENSMISGTPIEGRQPLMSRGGKDISMYWTNQASLNSAGVSDGHNLPGSIGTDLVEPEGRYMADVGFRGVSPGQPHGVNDQISGESPFCAIAWGENFFGYLEHIAEGSTQGSTATNQVRFYRQSFGPYHSGLRNLKIQGFSTPVQNGVTSIGAELKVLSQQRVFTRHGAPLNGQGNFATDGFRNFFAAADKLALYALNSSFGVPNKPPYAGGTMACIQGWYTDAVGRYPLQMQGPETRNKPYPGLILPYPNSFRDDLYNYQTAINPSAPRVIWDGNRFVAFWTEGGAVNGSGGFLETPTLICMATFPGKGDESVQGPEMVDPNDMWVTKHVVQAAFADSRSTFGSSPSGLAGYSLTMVDIAYSGRVYGVLWTAGIDPGSPLTNGNACAVVGVSLFDGVGSGSGNWLDYEPQPYGNFQGTTSGNVISDSTSGLLKNPVVNVGDILVCPPGNQNGGVYLVVAYGVNSVTVYPSFPGNLSPQPYFLHRPRASQGAATYILDETYQTSGRDAYTSPCIVWDGKQFMAVWRSKVGGLSNLSGTTSESFISYCEFPEAGLGHPPVVKRFGGGNPSASQSWATDAWGGTQGVGLVQPNDNFPNIVYMVNPATPVLSGSTGTITSANNGTFLLVDSGQNFSTSPGSGPIKTGDLVVITSGTYQYKVGTVVELTSSASILCSNDYAHLGNTGVNFTYQIFSKQRYKVGPGDILRVNAIYLGSTDQTPYHGEWTITNVDLYNNLFVVNGVLANTTGTTATSIWGTIVSGSGYGDPTQAENSPFYQQGANVSMGIGQDIGPNPKVLGRDLLWSQANQFNSPLGLQPDRLFKMVYNDVTEEYAILYEYGGNIAIGVFDKTTYTLKKETPLSFSGDAFCGDLAWNGSRYLAVWGSSGSSPGTLYYTQLGPSLGIEDAGQTGTSGNLGIATLSTLTGNTEGTVPGPTYALPEFTVDVQWRNCCVRWNSRLNRWVISASMYWLLPQLSSTTKENQYSTGSHVQTNTFATEFQLQSTTVTSYTNNVLTLATNSTDQNFLQSGLKFAWLDPSLTTSAWGGMAMITSVGTTSPTVSTIQLSCAPGGTALTSLPAGSFFVLPREDVLVWTLGYDSPSIQLEDADACFLDNVALSGGGSDIEEKFLRMSRPIWQTGGSPVGMVFSQTVQQRGSQYNHLLLSPSPNKVATLRYTNVKSTSKFRYGPMPSTSLRDRGHQRERG